MTAIPTVIIGSVNAAGNYTDITQPRLSHRQVVRTQSYQFGTRDSDGTTHSYTMHARRTYWVRQAIRTVLCDADDVNDVIAAMGVDTASFTMQCGTPGDGRLYDLPLDGPWTFIDAKPSDVTPSIRKIEFKFEHEQLLICQPSSWGFISELWMAASGITPTSTNTTAEAAASAVDVGPSTNAFIGSLNEAGNPYTTQNSEYTGYSESTDSLSGEMVRSRLKTDLLALAKDVLNIMSGWDVLSPDGNLQSVIVKPFSPSIVHIEKIAVVSIPAAIHTPPTGMDIDQDGGTLTFTWQGTTFEDFASGETTVEGLNFAFSSNFGQSTATCAMFFNSTQIRSITAQTEGASTIGLYWSVDGTTARLMWYDEVFMEFSA